MNDDGGDLAFVCFGLVDFVLIERSSLVLNSTKDIKPIN